MNFIHEHITPRLMLRLSILLSFTLFTFTSESESSRLVEVASNSSNSSVETDPEEAKLKFDMLQNFIYKYILPIIVGVGIVGNSLTIIILSKEQELNSIYDPSCSFRENLHLQYIKNSVSGTVADPSSMASTNEHSITPQRKHTQVLNNNHKHKKPHRLYNTQFSSTNYFIFSLAVSDLIYNFILALVWITRNDIMNILDREYLCQWSVAVTYICSFLSAAFTTLFTFQRFIGIVNPLKSATSFSLQSPRIIRRVIIVLVIFSCVAYSYSLVIYDAKPKRIHEKSTEDEERCGPALKYRRALMVIDNTLDVFLTMIAPAICILFMNFSICRSLSKYSKENIFYTAVTSHAEALNKSAMSSTRKQPQQPSCSTLNNHSKTDPLSIKDMSRCHSLSPSRCGTPARLSQQHQPIEKTTMFGKNSFHHLSHYQSSSQINHSALSRNVSRHKSSPTVSINNASCVTKNETSGSKRNSSSAVDRTTNEFHGSFCKDPPAVRTASTNSTRITKILLIVSFCFLLLNSPYRAAILISNIHMFITGKTLYSMLAFIVNEVLLNLYFASYSVNFFLYSLCGKKFRESLKGLCFALVFFFYFRLVKLLNWLFKRG